MEHPEVRHGRRRDRRRGVATAAVLAVVAGLLMLVLGVPERDPPVVLPPIPPIADDLAVTVDDRDGVLRLLPQDTDPQAGIVFYPGARIWRGAYAPTLAPIADALDVAVFVPGMPFNLATLDEDALQRVITEHPRIERWVVGGHSMGGIATFNYLADHLDAVEDLGIRAVVAWASTVADDLDLRGLGVPVLHVAGSLDAVIPLAQTRDTLDRLPADAQLVVIEGMAHGQFARYSDLSAQPNGRTDAQTLVDLVDATVGFLSDVLT